MRKCDKGISVSNRRSLQASPYLSAYLPISYTGSRACWQWPNRSLSNSCIRVASPTT